MKSQRMRLAMRGTVIFGPRKEARRCELAPAPMIQPVAVFEKVNHRRKYMTAVGDTLSAARDIETSARMMCMVTAVRDCAASTLIVWLGGLIAFSGSSQERWWGMLRVSWLVPCGAVRSLSDTGACATVMPARLSIAVGTDDVHAGKLGEDCHRKDCACVSGQP
jgi:hypothetical protein